MSDKYFWQGHFVVNSIEKAPWQPF